MTSLELSGTEFRSRVEAALDHIVAYVDSLPAQPTADLEGGRERAAALAEPLPTKGASLESLLDLVFHQAVPKGYNTAGPGYLAYIPGGGILDAALADLISSAVNRYTGVWLAAPGLVQLEANVVRWFCEMIGYGPQSLGFLTSGGSLANFSAVLTARCALLPEDFLNGTIYASDQVHHSIHKAAHLAGFPPRSVRAVPSDDLCRIRLDQLVEQIEADQASGDRPFLIVGSGGTVNTGAVDDLEGLADVAHRFGMWLHIDAAYGGFFALTDRGRKTLAGIERADSVTLDPHKGLFLPYGTGSLLVKNGDLLRRAHAIDADYLPAMQGEDDFVDFCQISPELSKPFRGLSVWLAIKLHGIDAFRACLDEKLDLTQWAAEELRKIEGIEIVAEPQLSLVSFRLAPDGVAGEALDHLNRELRDRINAGGRVFLTGTVVDGRYVIRICVLSFRTHQDRMEQCLEDIRRARSAVVALAS